MNGQINNKTRSNTSVIRILGIDPGSRLAGYGCVDLIGNQIRHVTHGTLKLSNTSGKAIVALEHRLLALHHGLSQIISEFKPQMVSIEKVFFAKNAQSALKLGQARGAALLSGAIHGLSIFEYSATEVKSVLAGHGQADKEQVAKMIQLLFGKLDFVSSDASDGLALAICHAYRLVGSKNFPNRVSKRMSLAESVGLTPEKTRERTLEKIKR